MVAQMAAGADTVYGAKDTQTRLASDAADNLIWDRYTSSIEARSPALAAALARVTFSQRSSPQPLHTLMDLVSGVASRQQGFAIVVGRSRRMGAETHAAELRELMAERGSTAVVGSEGAKTLGEVGAALVAVDTNASLLVMQKAVEAG